MYIRRTSTRSRDTGEPYHTHRLVESVRTPDGVRQRTLINLGRHFEVPREQWAALAQRIETLLNGQSDWVPVDLDPRWAAAAERYAAMVVQARGQTSAGAPGPDLHTVDVETLELIRPRSVAVEHVALAGVEQAQLEQKLEALGFTGPQRASALGTIIARMANPASERATHHWLQEKSALGELIGHDFGATSLTRLYEASDQLLRHKEALEGHLYGQARELFDLDETITLYDLTNTYFEGQGQSNAHAARGHSKEKRSDCPLVTLALVLDGSGFPKRSAVLSGSASEPQTLARMLERLAPEGTSVRPTVVLDAGIATEDNVAWIKDKQFHYVVVSRKRQRQFDPHEAVAVKEQGEQRVRVQRVVNEQAGEVELYCHSSGREAKERAIADRFAERFEMALRALGEGLHKKNTVKNYEKVLQRIGRLKQKYARAAQHYEVHVDHDPVSGNATALRWERTTPVEDTLPGVYCLRTDLEDWDERRLWQTYTMLTDVEAVFRSLKSELGLRPLYHQNTARVEGHLFISVLAYHLVHAIRLRLKAKGIESSWAGLRRQLEGQARITARVERADGKILFVRKATNPEPCQRDIYDALGLTHHPGKTVKTVVSPAQVANVVP